LSGNEVASRERVARAASAAIVPVGADKNEGIAPLAEEAVPQPADLRAVDAAEPIGAATDSARPVGPRAARHRPLGEMTRRVDAECHRRTGIVEIADMLD